MTAGLREKGIPAHVLAMNFRKGGERWGHAVCVYQLQGQWWAWDSYWKSLKIAPAWPNAENEALAYLKARPDLRGAVMERAEVLRLTTEATERTEALTTKEETGH